MIRTHFPRPKAVLVLIAAFTLGIAVPPVAAHYVYESERVAHYENNCVWNRSEISHGNNDGGYSKVTLRFDSDGPYVSCTSLWNHWNKAKMKITLGFSKDGSTNWGACATLGPKEFDSLNYNYSKNWEKYWSRPCGNGYYRTIGGAWGRRDASWHGGNVNSKKHKLPS